MSDATSPSLRMIPRAGERYRRAHGCVVTVEHYTETSDGEPGVRFHDPQMNWSLTVPLWYWNSRVLWDGTRVPRFTLVQEPARVSCEDSMTTSDAQTIREGDIVRRSGRGPRFRVTNIHNDGRSACFEPVKKDGTRDERYRAGHGGSLAGYQKIEEHVR